jgi:hypothetical protein
MSEVPIEVQKERLIREGEYYRVGVIHAKAQVAHALRPEAILHEAVDQAVGLAQARFGALLQPGGLSGLKLSSLLPYALTLGSYIARKRLLKPALAVGAVVAVGAAWLIRRKRG